MKTLSSPSRALSISTARIRGPLRGERVGWHTPEWRWSHTPERLNSDEIDYLAGNFTRRRAAWRSNMTGEAAALEDGSYPTACRPRIADEQADELAACGRRRSPATDEVMADEEVQSDASDGTKLLVLRQDPTDQTFPW